MKQLDFFKHTFYLLCHFTRYQNFSLNQVLSFEAGGFASNNKYLIHLEVFEPACKKYWFK